MVYSITQWLLFFYIYCFVGWVWETSYVSVCQRHFVNRGFMRGPFLPIYGSGAIVMLVVSIPFRHSIWLTYLSGLVGATILEYFTGEAMEAIFKVRYWDYSNQKFNFRGHICLSSSLFWGLATVGLTRYLHKPVERLVLNLNPTVLTLVTLVLTVYISADFALSFKAAIDLRNLLIKMEEEAKKVKKRADVAIAFAGDGISNAKDKVSEKLDEAHDAIVDRFDDAASSLGEKLEGAADTISEKLGDAKGAVTDKLGDAKEAVTDKLGDAKEAVTDKFGETREKISDTREMLERRREIRKAFSADKLSAFQKDMLRSNPMMSSPKFKESFEAIKEELNIKDRHAGKRWF